MTNTFHAAFMDCRRCCVLRILILEIRVKKSMYKLIYLCDGVNTVTMDSANSKLVIYRQLYQFLKTVRLGSRNQIIIKRFLYWIMETHPRF